MRSETTFNAWFEHAKHTQQVIMVAVASGDETAAWQYTLKEYQLWNACLADGWTQGDGLQALKEYSHAHPDR